MAKIRHSFQSAKANGADSSLVRAGDWNADHVGTADARKTANQTTTATAAAAGGDLLFAIGANEVWTFECYVRIGCSGVGGVKLAIDVPTSATIQALIEGTTTGPTAFTSQVITADATLTTVNFNNVAAQNGIVYLQGCVVNGANAGNVQLMFASVTAGQTSTLYANSYLTARRVA